uniref:Uncharacterized protein n=1 Tax=Oryza sativa subsp. japonica TaxID=39947 RepID=Q33AN6_ORYSJ|nr:hypothetical protein LOC_Os10g09040 [Oryza sativa Japonica Group]
MAIDQAELGEDPEDWRTPFVKYLKNGWLLEDEVEAKRLQLRATRYKLRAVVSLWGAPTLASLHILC